MPTPLPDLSSQSFRDLICAIKVADANRVERTFELGRYFAELQRRREQDADAFKAEFSTRSFARVVKEQFGYETADYAYKLIRHAEICEALSVVDLPLPNERETRRLQPLADYTPRLLAVCRYAAENDVHGKDLDRVVAAVNMAAATDDAEVARIAQAAIAAQLAPTRRMPTRAEAALINRLWATRPDVQQFAHAVRESGHYDGVVVWLRAVLDALTDQAAARGPAESAAEEYTAEVAAEAA